jgi:O-antigen/teichoic acid export membrane protein
MTAGRNDTPPATEALVVDGAPAVAPSRTRPASGMRNVTWNWTLFVFTVAITFFQSPFIVRTLGNTNYGIWVLVGSLVGYLGLLDFGVRAAVTRYVAKLHADEADTDASKLVSTALSIFGALGVLALIGSVVIALAILPRFHFSPSDLATARFVVILGGLTLTSGLASGAFGGVIVGLQRFDVSAKIDITLAGLGALAVYICLTMGFGIAGLATLALTFSIVRTLAICLVAFRLYPELHIRPRWHQGWSRQIFSFSVFSTLMTFSTTLILYSDSLVIGAFLPAAQITFFSIASSLTEYSRTLIRGISTTMTPRVSAIEGTDPENISRLVLGVARIATLLILPIGITFFLRGGAFIGLWMGPSYTNASGVPLRILTGAMIFSAATQVVGSSMLGLSKHKVLVPVFIAEAAANFGLSVFLIRRIGLPGVAWGTMVPNLVTSLIMFPLLTRRILGTRLWPYYREAWLRPLVAMIPFAIATALVERYLPGGNLFTYFAGVVAVLPLAVAGAWLIAMNPAERETLLIAVKRRARVFAAVGDRLSQQWLAARRSE